jgi:hypothetical protein
MPVPPTPTVILQMTTTRYVLGSTIRVTITNHGQQPIFFSDHNTNCTVLLVERQSTDSWESVAPCKLMIATRIHSLNAGATLEVPLATSAGQWSVGMYRAKLGYSSGAQDGPPHMVLSSPFQID